jgi:hypothetical protein
MGKGCFKRPTPVKGLRFTAPPPAGTSTDGQTPTFCLHHLGSPYCVTDCDRDDKAAFAETLRKLSHLTWGQIKQAPRHGLGCEKIPRNLIGGSIPAVVTEDVESFLAFRFSGKKPMVGYRQGAMFHILWLDHDFSLYPHGGS